LKETGVYNIYTVSSMANMRKGYGASSQASPLYPHSVLTKEVLQNQSLRELTGIEGEGIEIEIIIYCGV
jgi:hypothetical protein